MTGAIRSVKRIARIVGVALLCAAGLAYLLNTHVTQLHLESTNWTTSTRIELFLSTFNGLLLLILAKQYTSLYRRIPSQFTLGLVLFSVSLALYGLTSNPALEIELGYPSGSTQSPFAFIPDIFVGAAVLALLTHTDL